MAALLRYIADLYYYTIEDLADPRVKDLPLISSPWPNFFIMVFYNLFVQKIGPELMKKRQPINVKSPMILYNILQIVANGFFVIECFRLVWIPRKYSLLCAEVDYSYEPLPLRLSFYVWLFYLTKILDLLDTIFMVLRKKQKQVSFLHVYHHTGMVLAGWISTKYVAGGHLIFFGTVNAFVHVIMYTYYLITVIYPQYRENVWWKRHITELQLVQFLMTGLHAAVALFNPYCHFPKILISIFLPQDIFMFLLFWDFYRKAYLRKKPVENKLDKEQTTNCDINIHKKNKSD